MNAEDRLRAAFADRAGRATPGRSTYADVRTFVARRRRIRLATGASASFALAGLTAAAIVIAAPGADRLGPADPLPTAVPSVLPSLPPAPTAAPSRPASPDPAGAVGRDEFVGVHRGRLVVADAGTGAVRRALLTLPGDDSWIYHVTLSADRRTVYYSAVENNHLPCLDPRSGTIHAVDVATGEQRPVAGSGATHVQASPDGSRLLYLRAWLCDGEPELVVRHLATGRTTGYRFAADEPLGEVGGPGLVDADWMPAWGPDVLVFAVRGDEGTQLRSFRLGRDRTLTEGTVMAQWPIDAVRTDAADVFLLSTCCHEEFEGSQVNRRVSRLGTMAPVLDRPGRRLDALAPRGDGPILLIEEGRLLRYDGPGRLLSLTSGWGFALDW